MDTVEKNLRTEFLRILDRAGVRPWERIFHNMRASRQTELLAVFPAKDVCDWLGNSTAVAMKHYAMATSEAFDAATKMVPSASENGSVIACQEAVTSRQETKNPREIGISWGSVTIGGNSLITIRYSLEGSNL